MGKQKRGDIAVSPAMYDWSVRLETTPKYVVSATRTRYPWPNSHHLAGDVGLAVRALKDATPAGALLGSGGLPIALDQLRLIDEYRFLVHPRIAGRGPTLYAEGLAATRRLDLVSATPLGNGTPAVHYRRAAD